MEEVKEEPKGKIEESDKKTNKNYPNKMRPGFPTARDIMETSIIKNLINSYYHVVKKNINDLVPKTIMCFLVNQSKLMAEKEMVNKLFKSSELEILLQKYRTITNHLNRNGHTKTISSYTILFSEQLDIHLLIQLLESH